MSTDVNSARPSPLRQYLLRLPMAIPEFPIWFGPLFLALAFAATLFVARLIVTSVGLSDAKKRVEHECRTGSRQFAAATIAEIEDFLASRQLPSPF